MDNREEVLMELTRFESARQPDIPAVLEDFLCHVARTGDSVFPWPQVRPLLKRKLDLIADQYCQHSPPEKIPAMPNVDPFKYDQLRSEIHLRIDSLNGTPFTIQRLCELMTEPQRYYKRTDKFMRGVEKNVLVVTTIEATRRRPPPEAVNGAVGAEEEEAGVASRGVPSTSGAGRPPERRSGLADTEPADQPPTAAAAQVAMETNGEQAAPLEPGTVTAAETASTSATVSTAEAETPMELDQPTTATPVTSGSAAVTSDSSAVASYSAAVTSDSAAVTSDSAAVTSDSAAVTSGSAPVTSDSAPVTSEPSGVTSDSAGPVTSELKSESAAVEMTSEQAEVTSQAEVVTSESVAMTTEAAEEGQAAAPVDLSATETARPDCQQTAPAQPADSPVTVATEHAPAAAAAETGPAPDVLPSTEIKASALAAVSSDTPIVSKPVSDLAAQSSDPSEPPSAVRESALAPSTQPSDASAQPSTPSTQSSDPSSQPSESCQPCEPSPPSAEAQDLGDGVSLDSSNMSLDDSLCGGDAAAGSPPPPADAAAV